MSSDARRIGYVLKVYPRLTETFIFTELLAHQRAGRDTGIPEAIEDGRTGLLVGERRPAELAGALDRMLDDASLRVRLAGAVRARVEERFDVDRNAARLRAVAWGVRAGGHVRETPSLVGAA